MSKEELTNELKSRATEWVNDLFEGQDPKEKIKDWSQETTQLIQRHPWMALAGAFAIGYVLGSMGSSKSRRDRDSL